MMNSATSTETLPPKGGKHETSRKEPGGVRIQADDQGFHVSHFFVLVSLLAATVAVVLARPSAPEHLILISLTIGAAGISGLAFYRMLAPLVAPRSPGEREISESMRLELEREKALTLRSIKELEFDRAMGKVSPQDFEEMAGRLRARAVGIMKQLDAGAAVYRTLIEKELAARIGKGSAFAGASADKPAAVAAAVAPAAKIDTGMCACGTRNDVDARFCKSCGARLVGA
jgi:hypothetical protein